MEKVLVLLIPALLSLLLLRLVLLPIRTACKLALHSVCGFLCLWLLNTAAPVTGLLLPVNGVTVSIAGTLGLPGIGIIALLELL